ncbi:MAG TPA: IclR family transcriptional regulator [Phycisphaerales bacterium]|nr:IclR family transcriptional regulator [Phycisphaerales bacterium]
MNKYAVPNLRKAILVLKMLASAEQGISAVQIEQHLGIPRTTAFRILKTLTLDGMIDKKGSLFYAGAGLLEVGLMALRKSQLRESAVPILQGLTGQTGLTSHLAVPGGWHSLILEVCDSTEPIRVASRPGTLADLHCSATGKLFLAFCYTDRLEAFCREVRPQRRTEHTKITFEDLQRMVSDVRQCGYAVDEQEYHPHVRCMAAPVRDIRGQVVAAVGVTAPTSVFTKERMDEIVAAVAHAAAALSSKIGHSG